MQYVDAHTHRRSPSDSVTSLVNIRITSATEVFETDGICTVGLHPWDVAEDWRDAVDIVEELSGEELVLAIGECGLDRAVNAPWIHQVDAFEYIADLAERVSKPLVIHCVKAHDELLRVHKFLDPNQPWVLHGFVKGADLARQCLDAGMILSFGAAVLKESSSLAEAVRLCPPDRFLLETDTDDVEIRDIYAAVATMRGVPLEDLCATLQQTFDNVFKR
jgi:TatD DNase family protein